MKHKGENKQRIINEDDDMNDKLDDVEDRQWEQTKTNYKIKQKIANDKWIRWQVKGKGKGRGL